MDKQFFCQIKQADCRPFSIPGQAQFAKKRQLKYQFLSKTSAYPTIGFFNCHRCLRKIETTVSLQNSVKMIYHNHAIRLAHNGKTTYLYDRPTGSGGSLSAA